MNKDSSEERSHEPQRKIDPHVNNDEQAPKKRKREGTTMVAKQQQIEQSSDGGHHSISYADTSSMALLATDNGGPSRTVLLVEAQSKTTSIGDYESEMMTASKNHKHSPESDDHDVSDANDTSNTLSNQQPEHQATNKAEHAASAKKRRKPVPKPGLWRSTHMSPYNLFSGQPKGDALRQTVLEHGIRIPYNGWFGICFGLQLNEDLIQDGDYNLYIVGNSKTGKKKDEATDEDCNAVKRILLPLKHKSRSSQQQQQQQKHSSSNHAAETPPNKDDGRDPMTDRLTNINVGKLFYLSKGSTVLVVRNGALVMAEDEHKESERASDTTKRIRRMGLSQQQLFLVKWCVIAAHHIVRKGQRTRGRPHPQSQSQSQAHSRQHETKEMERLQQTESKIGAMNATHVICATCIRTFRSVHGVLCHCRSQHWHSQLPPGPMKVVKVETMWNTPLKVVFQDSHMAIVVKPQGMAVQGDSPSLCRSDLLMALKDDYHDDANKPTDAAGSKAAAKVGDDDQVLNKPIPCHRLDSPTGGLLVIAKTKKAEIALKLAFAEKKCTKRYRALVVGKVEPKVGECTQSMGGKDAHTKYQVVRYSRSSDKMMSAMSKSDGWITIMDLFPVTGRKHQLRKHMKALGHPIWGDVRYGHYTNHPIASPLAETSDPNKNPHSRLCLWAVEITLPHPISGEEMTFKMGDGDPDWLNQVVSAQGATWSKKQLEDR